MYETRGWTTYERCASEIAKSFHTVYATWNLVYDVSGQYGGGHRRLPTMPLALDDVLQNRFFTNGADRTTVSAMYKCLYTSVLRGIKVLSFSGLYVELDEIASLRTALMYCDMLHILGLQGMMFDDLKMLELFGGLADGALSYLSELRLSRNVFGQQGVHALRSALARNVAPNLRLLELDSCPLYNEGVIALASALVDGAGKALETLTIGCTSMGTKGATVLASAIVRAQPPLKSLLWVGNEVGPAGRTALVCALEGLQHGYGVRTWFSEGMGNAFFYRWGRHWRAGAQATILHVFDGYPFAWTLSKMLLQSDVLEQTAMEPVAEYKVQVEEFEAGRKSKAGSVCESVRDQMRVTELASNSAASTKYSATMVYHSPLLGGACSV